jgi:hypothetical protein
VRRGGVHWREDLRLHQAKPDDPSRPLGDDAWGEAEVDVDVGGSLTPEERAEQDSARAEVRSELHGRWRGPPIVTHAAAHVECVEAIFAAVPTV